MKAPGRLVVETRISELKLYPSEKHCFEIFFIQSGNISNGDAFWTDSFTFFGIGTVAKTFFIHLCNHGQGALPCVPPVLEEADKAEKLSHW